MFYDLYVYSAYIYYILLTQYVFNFVFEFVDKNIMLLMMTVFIKNNNQENQYQ